MVLSTTLYRPGYGVFAWIGNEEFDREFIGERYTGSLDMMNMAQGDMDRCAPVWDTTTDPDLTDVETRAFQCLTCPVLLRHRKVRRHFLGHR